MSTERELILLCRVKIEQILNWGDSSLWTNSDFELLSDKIFEKTTVRLSISTLKRIWGKVKYDNSPTAATLNALANFLDYASWRDFESEQSKRIPAPSEAAADNAATVPAPRKTNRTLVRVLTTVAAVSASVVLVLLLVKGKTPHVFNPELAVFRHQQVTDDLPNSVVFDYDVSRYDADSAFIQQNWDPRRREKVSLARKQHTSVYYVPGHFKAKLVVNNTVVKEDIVYIQTKGWRALIENDPTPIYVSTENIKLGNSLGFTSELLRDRTGSPVFNRRGSMLMNVQDFNVDVANFDFETLVRNNSTPEESICRKVMIELLTSEMAIIVPLSTKGCVSEIGILSTEGWKDGKENDFSAFGCEFKNMEKLQITSHDSTLNIILNDKVIFTEKQKNAVGKVVGLRIGFEGAGEMQYAKLNGKLIE